MGRVRATNQDSYCAVDLRPAWEGHVFAVADGMGGHVAGEVASAVAVMAFLDAIRERLAQESGDAALPQAIVAAFQAANAAVATADPPPAVSAARTRGGRAGGLRNGRGQSGMGTTLTAVLVNGNTLAWGHVGDSRAYLFQAGELRQLTQDHSVVGELVRQGRLSEVEAAVHPQRNVLTSALGMGALERIDNGRVELQPGDALLLCTDGLTNLVAPRELADAVREASRSPDAWDGLAPQLVALANRRGGHDNVTLVAVIVP